MHISLYVHAKFTKHGMQAIHVIPDELIKWNLQILLCNIEILVIYFCMI
jgi:hypothetical protein